MKKKQNKFGKMPSGPFNIVIFVVLLIACIFMLSKVADTVKDKGEIPCSEYLNLIEQDKVKKVEILGSFVNGVTKSDKPFETNVAEYSGHWDLLRKHNVEFMIINQSNQFNMWYLLLLIMLVAALALMWYFFKPNRDSNGGGGGNIFTMGKTKAKMFLPSTIKEKFSSVAGADEAKEELEEMVDFLKNPEKRKQHTWLAKCGELTVSFEDIQKTTRYNLIQQKRNDILFVLFFCYPQY